MRKPHTAKIGLFIILAVILLIAGLLAFGAKSFFTVKKKAETAISGAVNGLSVGSRVELRGVPIGKVTRIAFSWSLYPQTRTNLIVVEFEVEPNLMPLPPGMTTKTAIESAISRGLRAVVKSQGITGTSILALEQMDPKAYPPPALDYTPRHYYIPSAPPQLTRLTEALEKTLAHIEQLDIASISARLTNTLGATHDLITKVGEIDFANLGTNANSLLLDLKKTSVKLTASLEDVQKKLDTMKLDAVSKNADGLVTGLRETNLKLQAVLDKLDSVPMQQTVADLQLVFQNLNEVLAQLKEYPSAFIFGKPPEPVEGLQHGRR